MNTQTTESNQQLSSFRSQIDAIDDKIINLLFERIQVVKQVGKYKQKTDTALCPIRSGREAEMLRRIAKKFQQNNNDKIPHVDFISDFPPAAAASIWRIIIGASTGLEADMTLSIFATEQEKNLYWLGREYFGSHSTIIKQPHVNRVVGDVVDGKAAVGIVPFPHATDNNKWWLVLLQQGENAPKIFAHIPFVSEDTQNKNTPKALAFAKLIPEASGDDKSLLVIEADANVSQSRLQTAFQTAKLEVNWLDIAAIASDSRHHFVEIKGFITPDHAEFTDAISSLGASILLVSFLGAYAVPMSV